MVIEEDSGNSNFATFLQMLEKAAERAKREKVECIYKGVNLSVQRF